MNFLDFSPNELEFFAENVFVEVTPNFAFETLNLITVSYPYLKKLAFLG